jgi:hypothetical protein
LHTIALTGSDIQEAFIFAGHKKAAEVSGKVKASVAHF